MTIEPDLRSDVRVPSAGGAQSSIDFGRVGVVALFTLTAISNASTVTLGLLKDEPLWHKASTTASSLLALSFCVLVVQAYLRRGRAAVTDRNPLVWAAAPLATAIPLVLAAVPPADHGPLLTVVHLTLSLVGMSWSVASVRTLGTNLSIVPQARSAVTHGPYRFVRHPLYLGELAVLTGVVIDLGRASGYALLAVEVVLQVFRADREERLLSEQVPGYRDYSLRTRRLIPGVW